MYDLDGSAWVGVPWRVVDTTVIERHDTFVAAEMVYTMLAALCVVHAVTQPEPTRRARHVLLLGCAACGGLANDVVFMFLPLTENFWHGQATVMFGPRLPAYIPLVYLIFLYIPTAVVWQLDIPRPARPFLIGPMASCFYAPFDIVGAKFLWWTWHDTDNNAHPRLFGVPVASTMWVCVFSMGFSALMHVSMPPPTKELTLGCGVRAFATTVFFAVPLMMVNMMLIQTFVGSLLAGTLVLPPMLPAPNLTMLVATIVACLCMSAVLAAVSSSTDAAKATALPGSLVCLLGLHFGFLFAVGISAAPETQVSVGIHQRFGGISDPSGSHSGVCAEEAVDWSGSSRRTHLCTAFDNVADFAFIPDAMPAPHSEWYALKGVAKSRSWTEGMLLASCGGSAMYFLALATAQLRNAAMLMDDIAAHRRKRPSSLLKLD